ncbi:MAG: DegT/DnrJ/EryC1/StrS family aminotransferase [Thermogutta sp.]
MDASGMNESSRVPGSSLPPRIGSVNLERPVPFLDLKRIHEPLRDRIVAALADVCDSGAFVLGPEVERLEQALAEYCQIPYAIACSSGSEALLLALMALGVGPGDEVIVPSFTFFATASAVSRLGATPVFADIDPKTFNISPLEVARLIHRATKAVLPVHLFGQAADMGPILSLAQRFKIAVVEDAAQAIGAEYQGRRVGSLGCIGCFSFYPTKNLGSMGDAGMVTASSAETAETLRLLRVHGMHPRYYHSLVGINGRMDAFQAAVLNIKFELLEAWTAERSRQADTYCGLFREFGLENAVGLPVTASQGRHVWNQFVIRVREGRRDALRKYLSERKVGSEIYYPLGLHEQACFSHLGYAPTDLPETFAAAREVLALPIFPGLTVDEQYVVVARIAEFYRSAQSRNQVAAPVFLSRSANRVSSPLSE